MVKFAQVMHQNILEVAKLQNLENKLKGHSSAVRHEFTYRVEIK